MRRLYSPVWRFILFFFTVAVGINFRPFVNKLIWVSVKTSSERFFIKFPLLFVRELFDTFLRSLRFFVFICFFVSLYFPFFALSLWGSLCG